MNRGETAEAWRSLLPIGGVDGTLENRFTESLRGRVLAKTGTLTHVSGLSGYVRGKHGWVVFSILVSQAPVSADEMRKAIDRVVAALAE